MTINDIVSTFDTFENKSFDENNVSNELRKLLPPKRDETNPDLLAEIMAFEFMEDYQDEDTGWGTYFGPMIVWNNADGSNTKFPSIGSITPEMIAYWENRANESRNPILVARYSGLVWDFQSIKCKTNPSHKICRLFVDAALKIANEGFFKYEVTVWKKLERAINLSISLNDDYLIDNCKKAIIDFEKKYSQDNKPGLWGNSFDLLIGKNKIKLSVQEESFIIKELEDKLYRLTKPDSNNHKIDPWAAEISAIRLAEYYKGKKRYDDVKRVILEIGNAYDKIIGEASAIQAINWFNHLYGLYKKYDLKEEAANVLLRIREIGPKIDKEMTNFSHSFSIPQETIDAYLKEITDGTIEEVLTRICFNYIPHKNQVKEEIFNLSKKYPMVYLSSHEIQDGNGRVIATIGSLKDDWEGHIVRQISMNLSFLSIFLDLAIKELIVKSKLDKNAIINFIQKTPIIKKERLIIIEKGLEAFFSTDYITFIHLIIPQIEEAIRNLLELAGGNVLKPSKKGGFQLKTFDELLRDDIIVKNLKEDFVDYFRMVFTDPRGWNMRNNVCHGMANPEMFNPYTADWVLHGLLCLGLIKIE